MSRGEPFEQGGGEPRWIVSRDNATLRLCRRLASEPAAYRELGRVWLEGEHLCRAFVASRRRPEQALVSQSAFEGRPELRALARQAAEVLVVTDALFGRVSSLPSPAGIAFVVTCPAAPKPDPAASAVLLDRIQDAGNVGSILRSASAMGVRQVWALVGTAGLWSPKVVRGAMGAHFDLSLTEGLTIEDLPVGTVPWLATDAHAGIPLPQAQLPAPCVWALGHEGQGLAHDVLERCSMTLQIPQPGGQESLNVAAAAAICLYESARQRGGALAIEPAPHSRPVGAA